MFQIIIDPWSSGRDGIVVVEIDIGGGTCKHSDLQLNKRVKEVSSVRGIKWIEIVYLAFMVKKVFYRHQ